MAIYALALALPSLPSSDGEPTLPWNPGVGAGTPYTRAGVGGRRRLLESCSENYRVNNEHVRAVPNGCRKRRGRCDSSGSETHCSLCPANYRVESSACVACAGGSTRAAGDNPLSAGNTTCGCATDERVFNSTCTACRPAGMIRLGLRPTANVRRTTAWMSPETTLSGWTRFASPWRT